MTFEAIIEELNQLANPEKIAYKEAKSGIIANNPLGVYQKDLKAIAKRCGKKSPENNKLALALFETGIYECRLLCSKIFDPKQVTEELMEKWVVTFENWAVCDSFCMSFLGASPLALNKITEWTQREEEFQKRAGFTLMVGYCFANKNASNNRIESFLPIIENAVNDNRIYVKKAVNWALRSIGKRNVDLQIKAIETAENILRNNSKSAQWIAKDALKELQAEKVSILDYPRSIYRPKQ